MQRKLCILAGVYVAAIGILANLSAAPIADGGVPLALYVAANGRDAWTGRRPEPEPDGGDGPFATLTRARDELRALRKNGELPLGATVWVRGGAYYLNETFALSAIDSGTADGPVAYRAYRRERPILVGGVQVTGFTPHAGGVMKVDLSQTRLKDQGVGELFFNGQRQILARYPNFDAENPYAGGFLYVEAQPEKGSKTSFQAPADGVREWARPQDGAVWGFPGRNYWNNIIPIQSVDRESRTITLTKPASYEFNPGDRYFVRGLFEELDAPGEWYFDRTTAVLYFWPSGDVSTARVSVPGISSIIAVAKAPNQSKWPEHITLQGFTIEGGSGAAVAFTNARSCALVGSVVRNASRGVSLSTCKDCLVYGNDISHTGSSGVTVGSGNRSVTRPDGNRVENNYIHHTGYYSKTSSAVSIHGVANTVSHNLIHDCPRIAVSYGGNDHIIEYNHLRHMNLETQDSGATYCLGRDWTNRGHIVRYNYIHDTLGYGRHSGTRWHSPFFTFGIYLDDWSSGHKVYGNIVARSYLAGIDVHSGRDNIIENNIIYDCNREQFRYQSWPTSHRMLPDMLRKVQNWAHSGHYPGLARHKDAVSDSTMSYNVFARNIIVYGRPGSRLYAVSGLDYSTTEHDHNLIWRKGGAPDSSLEKMRENGKDTHSVVADPKLADPDNGDFTLAADSPALALGFKPIPFDRIGPYHDARRASWPVVEVPGAREHPHMPNVRLRSVPTYAVARRQAPVTIDGRLDAAEWQGLDRSRAMVLAQEPGGRKGAKPPSYAWLLRDDTALYIALLNEVTPGKPLSGGHRWGGDDGAEVCLQRSDDKGPVFVLQGFADGHFQSTDHAGAPREGVGRAGRACSFGSSAGKGQWTGEWRVPFAALGIDAEAIHTLRFNIGVRKTGGPVPWITWVGTGGPNFQVDQAGQITLGK